MNKNDITYNTNATAALFSSVGLAARHQQQLSQLPLTSFPQISAVSVSQLLCYSEVISDCFFPLRHYSNHVSTTAIIITSYLTLQLPLAGRSACVALMVLLQLQTQQVVTNRRQERRSHLSWLIFDGRPKGKPERKPKRRWFPSKTKADDGRQLFLLAALNFKTFCKGSAKVSWSLRQAAANREIKSQPGTQKDLPV